MEIETAKDANVSVKFAEHADDGRAKTVINVRDHGDRRAGSETDGVLENGTKSFTVENERQAGSMTDDRTSTILRQSSTTKGQGNAVSQQTMTGKGGPVTQQMSTGKDVAEKVSVKRLAVSHE